MPPRRPLARGAVALKGFCLDSRRYTASLDGVPLTLTPTEFRILFILIAHPGWIWTRDELSEILYGDTSTMNPHAIDSHIKNLRKKCRAIRPTGAVIRTVYGIGYALEG